MSLLRFLSLVLLASSALAAPLRVVALHSVLGEVAERVGGPELALQCLLPGGVDPHTFNPSPGDVREIRKAELVLASGFGLEPYLDRLVENSGTKASLFLASSYVTKALQGSCTHGHDSAHASEHDHGEMDPHWWHSVDCVAAIARGFAANLEKLRPEAAPAIKQRLATYLAELSTLQAWAGEQLAKLPSEKRHLVTSHDAFGYLARDFGFEVHPLQGLNPESEPNARTLTNLVKLIRSLKVKAVFLDNTENPKLLAAMLEESGARVGGTLFADGLGPKGSPAETVSGMFRHNIGTIVDALR